MVYSLKFKSNIVKFLLFRPLKNKYSLKMTNDYEVFQNGIKINKIQIFK